MTARKTPEGNDRLNELERALIAIREETDHALRHPEVYFLTICRIACLARRALGEAPGLASVGSSDASSANDAPSSFKASS